MLVVVTNYSSLRSGTNSEPFSVPTWEFTIQTYGFYGQTTIQPGFSCLVSVSCHLGSTNDVIPVKNIHVPSTYLVNTSTGTIADVILPTKL